MTIQTIHEEFSVCKVADYGGLDLSAPFVFTGLVVSRKKRDLLRQGRHRR